MRKAEEATTLHILPMPKGGRVTPGEARRWMAEDLRGYLDVLQLAVEADLPHRTAGSYGILAVDLISMVDACNAAMQTRRAVRVEHQAGGDYESDTRDLVRIVASRFRIEDGGTDGPNEDAFRRLGAALLERAGFKGVADAA